MWQLICAVMHLALTGRGSPGAVRAFLGALQWFDLLQRCKLSLYNEVYVFARRRNEWEIIDMPTSALTELICGVVLAPYWAGPLI